MTNVRIAYTSITPTPFSRAKVHIEALRAVGVPVLEVFNAAPGVKKYLSIISGLLRNKDAYDCIVVGFPGYALVPLIRAFFSVPVIFDAGWPLYDGEVASRKKSAAARVWLTDKLAFSCADSVWLESDAQVEHCARFFGISKRKLRRIFTGVDERVFFKEAIPRASEFTAVFRGKHLPEAGIEIVLEAARLLPEAVRVRIMSPGYAPSEPLPKNVAVDDVYHKDPADIRRAMRACHVSIGQVSAHERLERTIPHKAFETFAMGIPYVTSATAPLKELAGEGGAIFISPGSAKALSEAIIALHKNTEELDACADAGLRAYAARASWKQLAEHMCSDVAHVVEESKKKRFRVVRFAISGASASLVNLGLVYVATEVFGFWYLLSSACGFCAGVAMSFVLQRWWTFKNKAKAVFSQFLLYATVAVAGLAFNTSAVYALVHFLGVHYLVAQVIAGVFIAACNFMLYSWYIFRTNHHGE